MNTTWLSRRHTRRRWLLPALFAALLIGCTAPLASLMVHTPNRLNPLARESNPLPPLEAAVADQQFFVHVGPPEAIINVSIVEPPRGTPLRGTVLVVHGIFARGVAMLHHARRLAEHGYRAALVDLRGHGRSTGEWLTFGVQEARDLSQVIDALVDRGLAGQSVGVYGISYGATTSIHLAAIDPRVAAVVAVEPFAAVRPEVPHFGRVMVPGVGLLIPEGTYQKALDEAGQMAGFDPDHSDATDAIRRASCPVLVIHGTADCIVPHSHGVLLHDAAPDHTELLSVPWQGHTALWLDVTGHVAGRACEWFDACLAGARRSEGL
jgi:pimeloyl-ACP methyl ester carboxylesterase